MKYTFYSTKYAAKTGKMVQPEHSDLVISRSTPTRKKEGANFYGAEL